MNRRVLVLAALLLPPVAASPPALPAQSIERALPGRFEQGVTERPVIRGLTATEALAWTGKLTRVAEILAANPAAARPPQGVCTRLSRIVNQEVLGPRAVDHVSIVIPVLYSAADGCSEMSNTAVRVSLNDPLDLLQLDGTPNPVYAAGGQRGLLILQRTDERLGGFPVYRVERDRVVLIPRGTEPVTVPVTVEEYLRHRIAEAEGAHASVQTISTEPMFDVERWLREDRPRMIAEHQEMVRSMAAHVSAEQLEEMRANFHEVLARTEAAMREAGAREPDAGAMVADATRRAGGRVAELHAALDSMSPTQRQSQACADPNDLLTGLGACHDRNGFVALNPRYFDPRLPRNAVQLIMVTSKTVRTVGEIEAHARLRQRIFDTLDYAALAELLD